MASSSVCKNKISNIFFVHYRTSQHGAWLMPGAQTTSLPHRDESTKRARVARPNSMVLVSCSSLRRSVLTAVRAWCPQLGLSGTRDVPATEGVVRRPARASLLDAEQTRATSMSPETCCDLLERQRSFNRATLQMLQCLRTNRFVHFFVVGPAVEGQHGPQELYRGEDLIKSRWTVQASIAAPKTMAASKRCSITPPSAVNMVNTTTLRRVSRRPQQHQQTIHFLQEVASPRCSQECAHHCGRRVRI